MSTAIYYPTWSAPWTSDPNSMTITKIDVNIIYLAFANQTTNYYKNQKSFVGTGLEFSQDFSVVAAAIKICTSKGIKVMLSVGGGAYWSNHGSKLNASSCVALMEDLGCSGIDIDWESTAAVDYELTKAIRDIKYELPKGKYLSFAGFSTGAYGKDGDIYKGNAINAMSECGSLVDWINIMAYDAGPNYDPRGAFECYKIYYNGPLYLGFEPGNQAWGGHVITEQEVEKNTYFVKAQGPEHGIFIWCYGKGGDDKGPSAAQVLSISKTILGGDKAPPPYPPMPPPQPPQPTPPATVSITCPVCSTKYVGSK